MAPEADDRPSCRYYEHLPCDRPRECPVHGPPLKRPRKPHHHLLPDLHGPSYDLHGQWKFWRKTPCGLYLHDREHRSDAEAEVLADPTWEQGVPEDLRQFRACIGLDLWRGSKGRPHYKHLPIPAAPGSPYQIYYQVGRDRAEVLVVGPAQDATCQRCARSRAEVVEPDRRPDPPRPTRP